MKRIMATKPPRSAICADRRAGETQYATRMGKSDSEENSKSMEHLGNLNAGKK